MYFQKYGVRSTWLEKYLKSLVSEENSTKNIVNQPKHWWNLHRNSFTLIKNYCTENWVEKKSLLLICKILGLPVNTLTTDDKYSLINRDNLTEPIQNQLSKKQKTFCQFLFAVLKCRSNFKHFGKKDDPHGLCIFENTVYKSGG